MIRGKLLEPLVMDIGKDHDVYICRGVWIDVKPCDVQPNSLSKSAVREVMQRIKRDGDYKELLDGD